MSDDFTHYHLCNAHARRKFKESEKNFEDESQYFLKLYSKIYRLEDSYYQIEFQAEQRRSWQRLYMEVMHRRALSLKNTHSKHSSIIKAVNYFLNNFEELVRFTKDPKLPLDNNFQERQLRSPVVGRKTWYGTHSRRGAKTTAIMFSVVQSCKLNNINPREYLKSLVRDIHQGKAGYSPYQYQKLRENSS